MARTLNDSVPPLDVSYSARFEKDNIRFTIYAVGHNRTTGFRTFFQVDPAFILPAIVDFINIPPSGIVLQVVTPFSAHITMAAASIFGEKQHAVTIHDVSGSHSIPIQPWHGAA
jgi:hypothetical protein